MLQNRLITAKLLLVLGTGYAFAAESPVDDEGARPPQSLSNSAPLALQDALAIALANNQGLAELQSQSDALGAVPSQAGTLPDPTLGFNALNLPTDTFDRDQEAMTQMQVTLSQAFPFPGKLGLKREAAQYAAGAAAKQVLDKRLQVAADVRTAWWELMYLDRALVIVDQNQAVMRDFIEIAQTKYKVGNGLQQYVLRS